jgi:hypothetical protein
MLADQSDWRTLAERAAKEQDNEQLMAIVEELNGVLAGAVNATCVREPRLRATCIR